jgi:hypothetical protein
MMEDFSRRLRKGNNLWWITAFAVLGFFLCVGMAMLLRYFNSAQPTALPNVPAYVYNSPTPALPNAATLPSNVIYITATPAPALPTPIPTATATSYSYWSWIFPNQVIPTSVYIPQPPPIQVVVIPITPLPTQPTLNPTTCKNILYPARPGSQWTYYVNTPKRSRNFNMRVVAVEGSQATVDAVELETGAALRTYVQCDRDVIVNFPLLSGQKLLGDIANGPLSLDYLGGVIAPNEAAFVSNNWALSWLTQYRISGSGMINFQGRDIYFDIMPSNIQMTCQTLSQGASAFETVTVVAGSFNALKVICRGDGQVSLTVNGVPASGSMHAQGTQWFAPNIGLVKSQRDYDYLDVFGFSIPLTSGGVSGYIELRSYVIGQ